ncbi:MAG: hypothetical protein ABMA14_09625 [Hyphomonadaceae bacterium]
MKFWAIWLAGMLALSAAFVATLWWISPGMKTTTGALMGAVVVMAFTVALIAGGMIPQRLRQKRGLGEKMRAPYRRYIRRFMPAMFGYVVLLLAAVTYAKDAAPTGVLAFIIAAAPAIPLLFAIRAIFLLPREEDDEYQRDQLYRAYAWATGATLAICTVWGFLDMFAAVPHAEMWLAFPIWSLCMGLARCLPNLPFAAQK